MKIGIFAGLGVALFLPLIAYSQPLSIGSSLITDGGFENGFTSWTQNWTSAATINSATPISGAQSLRITASPGGRGQIINNIEPGARYRISGMGRLAAAGEMASIGIYFENASGKYIVDQWIQIPDTTTQTYSFELQAPSGASTVVVYAYKNSGTLAADFDDINLVKIADP
jgi:hypothetical protein